MKTKQIRKPKYQFELFSGFEIASCNGTAWVCDCGRVHDGLFHCPKCKSEPPGGCVCPQCCDPVCLWEQ